MEIIRKSQGIKAKKPEGTEVIYYIFPEYEIHFNIIAGNSIQNWHHHNIIEEVIYVISGTVEFQWIENKKKMSQTLYPGDIVRVGNDPHTLVNSAKFPATFIVMRLVPTGRDNRDIIKNDKNLDQID